MHVQRKTEKAGLGVKTEKETEREHNEQKVEQKLIEQKLFI